MRLKGCVRVGRFGRIGPVGRVGLDVATVGAVVLAMPTAARAQTRLAVDAGWDDRYRPGQPMPVWVEVTADRLIQGTLVVTADDGTEVTLPVEVPGGSVKEYFLVCRPPRTTTTSPRGPRW